MNYRRTGKSAKQTATTQVWLKNEPLTCSGQDNWPAHVILKSLHLPLINKSSPNWVWDKLTSLSVDRMAPQSDTGNNNEEEKSMIKKSTAVWLCACIKLCLNCVFFPVYYKFWPKCPSKKRLPFSKSSK